MEVEFKELDSLTNTYSQEIKDILSAITEEEMQKPKILEGKLKLQCNIRTNKLHNFIHETYPLDSLGLSRGDFSAHAYSSLNALAQNHLKTRYDEFELLCRDWFQENLPDYSLE